MSKDYEDYKTYGYGQGVSERLYVIPQDEETRIAILNADRHTKEDLRLRHRYYLSHDWECNTIANTMMETVIKVLYSHLTSSSSSEVTNFIPGSNSMNTALNFYDLIEVRTSSKKNDNAEKEGNINVSFYPGPLVDSIISDDTPREDRKAEFNPPETRYSFQDDERLTAAMLKIEDYARRSLAEKNNLLLPNKFMALATTYIFLENLYRELIYKLTLTKKPAVTINFNDIIEFHATMKADGVEIKLRPGMGAKLIIKSDETTERDYDDEE